MSTDLDRLFGSLSHDADAIPLAEAATARRRGDQRRRTRLVAAAVATACVLAAGLTGGSWLVRDAAAPEPVAPAERTVPLGPVRPVGKELAFGAPIRFAMTGIVGDHAIAGWVEEDGTLRVAAADLATGAAAWPARTLGKFDDSNGTLVLPQAVLAIAEHNDGTDPDQTLFAVDPDTGELRWELPFSINDDDLIFYESVLVHVSGAGVTRGIDWRTGQAVWEIPAPADPPAASFGVFSLALTQPDNTLLQVTAGGALLIRNAATGKQTSSASGVGVAADGDYVASGDRLYAVSRMESPYRIRVSRLDGSSSSVYDGPAGRGFIAMAPCGTDQLCVLDEGDAEHSSQVAAIDVADRRELWRVAAPDGAQQIAPGGTRVVVTGQGPDGETSTLYDADGTKLATAARLGWVSTGTLLSFSAEGEVAAVTAADGSRRVLGKAGSSGTFCSWTETHLTCPTQTTLRIWKISP